MIEELGNLGTEFSCKFKTLNRLRFDLGFFPPNDSIARGSNAALYQESHAIYQAMARLILKGLSEIVICIDWSPLCADQSLHHKTEILTLSIHKTTFEKTVIYPYFSSEINIGNSASNWLLQLGVGLLEIYSFCMFHNNAHRVSLFYCHNIYCRASVVLSS